MNPTLAPAFLAAIVSTVLFATGLPGQITWTATLAAAQKQAAADKGVVYVLLDMDGDRDCEELQRNHFRDSRLAQLSRQTRNVFCSDTPHRKKGSCPRCKGMACADHIQNGTELRQKVLEVDHPVRTPQHLFLGPDGKILTSAAGPVTPGELEWLWVDAIREVQPTFAWEPAGRTRAPETFRKGKADTSPRAAPPPTPKETQLALKAIKKIGGGRGDWRETMASAQKNSQIIIRSDDKKALNWGETTLRAYRQFRNGLIRDIGKLSPPAWSGVLVDFLGDDSETTRRATAVALEGLGSGKAVAALRRAIRKEEAVDVRGRILRALAVCGPTQRPVVQMVVKAATAGEDPTLRAHAVVAAGKLEDRDAVLRCLHAGLQDQASLVRNVTAYVIAIRQERPLLDALQASIAAEADDSVKLWLERAMAAVRSRDTEPFRTFLATVLDGEDPGAALDRLREAGAGRGPGGGGRGAGGRGAGGREAGGERK